jgi:L-iditol 2-dehydrogenase
VLLVGTEGDVKTRSKTLSALDLEVVSGPVSGFSPTVWIEAAGATQALASAAATLPVGGRLGLVALYGRPPEVQLNDLVRKEVEMITSYSSGRVDYETALDVLARHPSIGSDLVRVFDLEEAKAAFDQIGADAIKIALRP